MNLLNNLLTKNKKEQFNYRLILDIGTEYLKMVLVEYNQKENNIIAFSRLKQDYANMEGGAITNIPGVVKKVKQGLNKVYSFTPYKARDIITGIAGEFVKGIVVSIEENRNNYRKKINVKEIDDLRKLAQAKAYKEAVKKVEQETGISNVKLELIDSSLVEIKVDGYKVNNPYHFQGKNINLVVFNTFAPLVQVGALQTVARELRLELAGIVAAPFAIANSIMSDDAYEFGAIIIDIGGGTTDIALIRNGGIEGTKMFAMGGRAFTRSIARNLDISLKEAESLKLAYSQDKEFDKKETIAKIIKADLDILYQGIEISLQELALGQVLPKDIYFCGGGSALKGLIEGIKTRNLSEHLPFFKEPNIQILTGEKINKIHDETKLLAGVESATPKALALVANKIGKKERGILKIGNQGL